MDATLLHPRFEVVTERPDGSKKVWLCFRCHSSLLACVREVRAVDHFSWSAFGENKGGSVNGYANPCEKMKMIRLISSRRCGCVRIPSLGLLTQSVIAC